MYSSGKRPILAFSSRYFIFPSEYFSIVPISTDHWHSTDILEKAKIITQRNINISSNHRTRMPEMSSSPLPTATLDLSRSVPPHELSTLV
ncbi:hypothetical protein Avbf_07659 [Armadillidium vulgare]|nr:hypothetical protein Avbf_07659 [Armadillidium vulgare]